MGEGWAGSSEREFGRPTGHTKPAQPARRPVCHVILTPVPSPSGLGWLLGMLGDPASSQSTRCQSHPGRLTQPFISTTPGVSWASQSEIPTPNPHPPSPPPSLSLGTGCNLLHQRGAGPLCQAPNVRSRQTEHINGVGVWAALWLHATVSGPH